MKKSVLESLLPAAAARGGYRGWETALSFGDPETEFRAARAGRGIADHSMFGRIEVTGGDRIDLLHRLSTNKLAALPAGGVIPTVFVTDKGRIIDNVVVAAKQDSLVLITSPGMELVLSQWIEKYTITEDIRLNTVTGDTVMASLIGSDTISMFASLAGCAIPENMSVHGVLDGAPFFVARTKDRRSDIAYFIAGNDAVPRFSGLIERLTGADGARWVGSLAYEGYRIASGIPASPGELNGSFNPLESGLRDSISFTKGCYIGQEVIARLDTYGKARRQLMGLIFDASPSKVTPVPLTKLGAEAGVLTSLTEIPFDGKYLGLAVVRNDFATPGDSLEAPGAGMSGTVTSAVSGT